MTDDDDVLEKGTLPRTLLPIAGQTLIEYQVRIARACGAGHIVVLVDRLPAALVAAFDRLREDGIDIDIARDAREAADRIHPDEQVLVMAGGLVASRAIVQDLASRTTPTLLTLEDRPEFGRYERMDREDRWSGLALIPGKLLRETAAILGDWTLGPTLLRTAIQSGVARSRHSGPGLALVQSESDAQLIAHTLAAGNAGTVAGFWQSQAVNPLVRRILPQIFGRNFPLAAMAGLPLVLMGTSMLAVAFGWRSMGFGLYLLSGFPAAAARAMADITARPDRVLKWSAEAKLPVLLSLLALAGWTLDSIGLGWGPLVLGLWAGIALYLQPRMAPRESWHADADLLALEMFMACLVGQPVVGLMIAVSHAVITQFWLVRR